MDRVQKSPSDSLREMADAFRAAGPALSESMAKFAKAIQQDNASRSAPAPTSEGAVEALAQFLHRRDWAGDRAMRGQRAYEYRRQAAAILNGEAWAIRKAWPEAAYEIKTRSDWSYSSPWSATS